MYNTNAYQEYHHHPRNLLYASSQSVPTPQAHHFFLFYFSNRLGLSVLKGNINSYWSIHSSSVKLFLFGIMLLEIILLHMSVVCFILMLNNIPLYKYTTISISVLSLMETWDVASFGYTGKSFCGHLCVGLFMDMFFHFSWVFT